MTRIIYKILTPQARAQMAQSGTLTLTGVDAADGFVHFSSAAQLSETLDKHYAGVTDLVLLAIDTNGLEDLRWEASRGGDLFPHLYAPLSEAMVAQEFALNSTRDNLAAWLQATDLESHT